MSEQIEPIGDVYEPYDPSEGVTGLEFAVVYAVDTVIGVVSKAKKVGQELLDIIGSGR